MKIIGGVKMDDLIYKFRKCTNYSFIDLFNSNITFATLGCFNDAMEGYIQYNKDEVLDILINDKSKRFIDLLIKNKKISCEIFDGTNIDNKFKTIKKNYKKEALDFIEDFSIKLFHEIRNSFFVTSFAKFGGHPVMWSHYSDDSSGYVMEFKLSRIKNEYKKYIKSQYPNLTDNQSKLLDIHEISYSKNYDCSNFIASFIKKKYHPSQDGINTFMKYIEETGDYKSVLYILTSKMIEWKYESELRIIFPKVISTKTRIKKVEATEYVSNYKSVPISFPTRIIAGENITIGNLAALAYYCKNYSDDPIVLSVQKRDFSIIENNIMRVNPFSKNIFKKY